MYNKSNKSSHLRCISLSIIVAIAMIIVSGTALAQTSLDEVKNIELDSYTYDKFSLKEIEAGDILHVNIQVTNGGPIDVLLMKSSDYMDYLAYRDFDYYASGSSSNIKSKSYSYTFPKNDDYYLVIDNTDNPKGGATPIGTVALHAQITIQNRAPIQNGLHEILNNANRLNTDYKLKLAQIEEIQTRADALTTAPTDETYMEWKLINEEAIESGDKLALYITENRDALGEKWVSDLLVSIAQNKEDLELENQRLELMVYSPESPGFGAILAVVGIIFAMAFRRR